MPIRLCLEPRCPNVVAYKGRCAVHRTQRNRETRSKNAHYYNTKRWAMLRRYKLALNPICERCDTALSTDVHHRHAIQDGGAVWAIDNLEALCHPCHSQITRREQQSTTEGVTRL